jgi:site-specific DNA-methyltransferase (adenine-specific)
MDEKMYTIEQLRKVKGIGETTIQRIIEQYAEPLEYDTSYRDYQPHELDYWDDDIWLMYGDCLDRMRDIPDGSVDMVLADLPYDKDMGQWDSMIPFKPLWKQYERITKPKGAIVLTASQPFTSILINSNPKLFKYCWVWNKGKAGNIFAAKLKPLITHEDVCIFSDGATANGSKRNMNYYPQMLNMEKPRRYFMSSSGRAFERESHKKITYTTDKKYPKSIIYFYNGNQEKKIHPTQKPVELCEYFISTYSKPGEAILDNVMGSGTTGVACRNLNRKFIGIELDEHYYKLARDRILEVGL